MRISDWSSDVCSSDLDVWTSARFSDGVIVSMSDALDRLKEEAGASSLDLVGYSGGGGVAVLLAARRRDVVSIVTIAGNLDQAQIGRASCRERGGQYV